MKINNSLRIMKSALLTVALSSSLIGCSAVNGVVGKIDNGSLDYQKSTLLTPLQLPVNKQVAPFVQIYPTTDLGDSSINLVNQSGKRYELPPPQRQYN